MTEREENISEGDEDEDKQDNEDIDEDNTDLDEDTDGEQEDEEDKEEREDEDENGNNNKKKVPSEIKLKSQAFDIAFHPGKNVIACGEISGKITLFNFSTDNNKKLFAITQHKKACRSLAFSSDGQKLYSCSKDKSVQVIDMNTGSSAHSLKKAHNAAVNCLQVISENYMATGSDDGVVKVWDSRTFSTIAEFDDRKDYISDMACSKERKHLLCTSGDGILSVFNLRCKKLEAASDQLEEELLSVAIVKNGQKVVCGSAAGALNIYSWGEWGDVSDRIPTNDSVDAICPITENIMCTGSGDGVIRSLYVQPHRAISVLGKHGGFGVESLKLSTDQQLMASCSSEKTIKFWDVSSLHEETIKPIQQKKKNRKRKLEASSTSNDSEFFADL